MAHRVLSHTADAGVEASAETFSGLVEELLRGMFTSMADISGLRARRWLGATIEAVTASDQVVDTLAESLYLSEVEDLMFCEFAVADNSGSVRLRLGGIPMADVEPTGAAIKAVTYHGLAVERRGDGWHARVFFDV